MTLYSCKHSGDQYRISKFDDDLNVQSSYLCTETECDFATWLDWNFKIA